MAKFMKDNLAGTVVVFSLLIWIPASCYINRLVSKVISFRGGERVCVLRDPPNPSLAALALELVAVKMDSIVA